MDKKSYYWKPQLQTNIHRKYYPILNTKFSQVGVHVIDFAFQFCHVISDNNIVNTKAALDTDLERLKFCVQERGVNRFTPRFSTNRNWLFFSWKIEVIYFCARESGLTREKPVWRGEPVYAALIHLLQKNVATILKNLENVAMPML